MKPDLQDPQFRKMLEELYPTPAAVSEAGRKAAAIVKIPIARSRLVVVPMPMGKMLAWSAVGAAVWALAIAAAVHVICGA